MSELSTYEKIRFDVIKRFAAERQAAHVRTLLKRIAELPEETRLSGDDSGLASFWEEFKYQTQRGPSFAFDAYEDTVRALCRSLLGELSSFEKGIMWLFTQAWYSWEFETAMAPPPVVDDVLEDLFYRAICEAAEDEPLEFDPDEDFGDGGEYGEEAGTDEEDGE